MITFLILTWIEIEICAWPECVKSLKDIIYQSCMVMIADSTMAELVCYTIDHRKAHT